MTNNNNPWYSNKELFERIGELKDDFKDLRLEMKETRSLIKNYNGLREELGKAREEMEDLRVQVQGIVSLNNGKNTATENFKSWGGWMFGLITIMVLLYNQFN